MDLWLWITMAVIGAFALGVLAGLALNELPEDEPQLLEGVPEPPSNVRRLHVFDRPYDWHTDGEA